MQANMRAKKRNAKTQFFKIARWLHVYISTALFALLVFFSITGITLNNGWYHPSGNQDSSQTVSLSASQLQAWRMQHAAIWDPNLPAIQRYITSEFGLSQPSSIDLDMDVREIYLEYYVPAGGASVIISGEEQWLMVETEAGSALGILNDLHKGRHSGTAWKWLIDVSAVLILLFSITGITLLFHGKKHRKNGVIATLLGVVSPFLYYVFWVPSVG